MASFKPCKGYEDKNLIFPKRSTKYSAGYDFFAGEDVQLPSVMSYIYTAIKKRSLKPTIVFTHIKADMGVSAHHQVLLLFNRSSNPAKGLILANGVGVVDADYYENKSNDGDIGFPFYNLLPFPVLIKKGQKIGQGIFMSYDRTYNDEPGPEREGGFGSTGE